jgi:hypothetical protein
MMLVAFLAWLLGLRAEVRRSPIRVRTWDASTEAWRERVPS